MKNLEELCKNDKVCVMTKHRSGFAYLTPNVNWQYLRLLTMEIPGPASASNWLNLRVTAVLSAIGLWAISILRKWMRRTTENVVDRSWWTS